MKIQQKNNKTKHKLSMYTHAITVGMNGIDSKLRMYLAFSNIKR